MDYIYDTANVKFSEKDLQNVDIERREENMEEMKKLTGY